MAQNVVTIVAGGYTETANAAWFSGTALSATTGAFTDATDSSSTTTGSLKTAGGLGVAKALWVGGEVRATRGEFSQTGPSLQITHTSSFIVTTSRIGGTNNGTILWNNGTIYNFTISELAGGLVAFGNSNSAGAANNGAMTLNMSTGAVTMGALTSTSTKVVPVAVASLPAGAAGMRAFVNNALAPVFGAAVAGGGAVTIPVFHDGVSWKVG